MAFIPQEVINQVREQAEIVDVIGQYVQLTRRGSNYMASCPFHEDNNPSFSVSQPKQIYKCFSCGRGGNVFGFIQEIEGIDFPQAVAKVAEIANVPLDPTYLSNSSTQQRKNQDLYDIHKMTAEFYHYYLMNSKNGQPGLDYLARRDLERASLEAFELGYAPQNSEVLAEYLTQQGFSQDQLLTSGIFYLNDRGQLIDRFRGRIIFPLKDRKGQIVAFSGRDIDGQSQAKYTNSPQTEIFNKSHLIYNLYQARPAIRQADQVIICEGYMDVIALHQAGFPQVVATMGTSLTQAHLDQLSKLSSHLYLIFDGDEAGIKATKRAFEMANAISHLQIKSVTIPNGQDPDEFIKRRGKLAFQSLLDQADTSYEFFQRELSRDYNLERETDIAQYIEALIPYIQQIPSKIEQDLRLQDLAQEFNLNINHLEELLMRYEPQETRSSSTSPEDREEQSYAYGEIDFSSLPVTQEIQVQSKAAFQSEKEILSLLIFYEEAWNYVESLDEPLLLFHEVAQRTYYALQEYYYDEGSPLPLTGIVDKIEDTSINNFLTSLIWDYELMGYQDQIIDDCLKVIQTAFIQAEIYDLRDKLKLAQINYDTNQSRKIMQEIMHLTRKIKHRGG
ncbi:DNA primase [Hutsoniella sourekii]